MSLLRDRDFFLEVAKGNIANHSIVHKFGRNSAVGGSFVPICPGGLYLTPQVASATALRVKAGNANDTAAGSGAREITLNGLDETGAEVTEAVATAGVMPSSATSATFIRLYRAFVSASGTYATTSTGSHDSDVVIENGAGGTDWTTISSTDIKRGQSQIACYSVPLGNTAYIKNVVINIDSTKAAEVVMLQRANILDASAPYKALRMVQEYTGISGIFDEVYDSPLKFPALTDILFLGTIAAGSVDIDIDFHIILVAD